MLELGAVPATTRGGLPGTVVTIEQETMVLNLITKFFGTKHERDVRDLWPLVGEINAEVERLRELSDDELRAKTEEFKKRLAGGESLDDLLIEVPPAVGARSSVRSLSHRQPARVPSERQDAIVFLDEPSDVGR